jgi:hypothetical protein
MYRIILNAFQTINELLTAGIAITAFSLLLYAFTFNLRDRVARSFAIILICVVIVFVGDTIGSTLSTPIEMEFWLRLQWVGIVFLPSAYLHFSDALLATTGRPSRNLRLLITRLTYLISFAFLITIPFSFLVGHLVQNAYPAPYLQRTWLTWIFTLFYTGGMIGSWANFIQAYRRTVTSTSRRRMRYLLAGALAPALGSFPYLLFGYNIASAHPILFWVTSLLVNVMVYGLLIIMAYSVAFFGVSWPDRVVKRRLFKWLMRGPITGSIVLAVTTIVRRGGVYFGVEYSAAVPISMVATVLVVEHAITLVAPLWDRWMFRGTDQSNMQLLSSLEERLLTSGDLRQFLESVLAAVCDRFQVAFAFIVTFDAKGLEMVVTIGGDKFLNDDMSQDFLQMVSQNGIGHDLFTWGDYWLIPLSGDNNDSEKLLGLMGFQRQPDQVLDADQHDALFKLGNRAAMALEDRIHQQQVVSSLESLSPEMDMIQRLRAASRYDSTNVLISSENPLEYKDLARWVKDALSHYWGGPKLTQSPLLNLKIVQEAMPAHEGNQANAMRAILNQAIEQTRPEGERRFTGEWVLYNILEMKFLEGRKVREIAMRLAMSEADLYRKQRVAIETVAAAIVEMEQKAREEEIKLEPYEELKETSDI